MDFTIRPATAADLPAIERILPRLASFDVPDNRTPEQLWQGDLVLVQAWANGSREDVSVVVAVVSQRVIGVAVISTRKELLTSEPSAHLEVLALNKQAEGVGIGSALLKEAESLALLKGARSMSLHVFAANEHARSIYEKHGYEGELLRYFKPLVEG